MKKILMFLAIFSFLFLNQGFAQVRGWCGTSMEAQLDMKERVLRYQEEAGQNVLIREGVMWIPVKIHLLQDDSGFNRADVMKVFDMLFAMNEDYRGIDIQFFLHSNFSRISNTGVNSDPQGSVGAAALSPFRVTAAINVYLVRDIPGSTIGSTLAYYQPGADWLVVKRSEVSAQKAETLTHELGHYFDLPHPFFGWDQEPYDEVEHGNPVQATSPSGRPTELVNGSNCQGQNSAGDGICDTRPNYGFGLGWQGCDYNVTTLDPNGQEVDPQEDNFMAYFLGCADKFTEGQIEVINGNLATRPYLDSGIDPDTTAFPETIQLVSPINSETTPTYTSVTLEWEAVPTATQYIVEVDKLSSFGFQPSYQFVTTNSATFEGIFVADKTYNWRVKPLKQGYMGAPVSATGKFRTGTSATASATQEIAGVVNYQIVPNPVSSQETLNINVETTENFDAKISLYNLSGQVMKTVQTDFTNGNNSYQLSVNDLSKGMYILSIESETGMLNEKVVIF